MKEKVTVVCFYTISADPNLIFYFEKIADPSQTKMRSEKHVNKVNTINILLLVNVFLGVNAVYKNGYMRGKLDGVI